MTFTKLSRKIFVTIFIWMTLAILLVGIAGSLLIQSALQKLIISNQTELAKQTMNKIDRMLYERIIDIQQIAGEESIEDFLLNLGKETTARDMPIQKILVKRMNELTFVTGPWDVLFVVDKNGKIVLSANEMLLGDSIQAYPYKAIAYNASIKGAIYYSDVVISKDTSWPTVIFSVPVINRDDPAKPIVGVIVGNFSWKAISSILEEVPAHTVLVNQSGQTIASNVMYSQKELSFGDIVSKSIVQKIQSHNSNFMILPKTEGFLETKTLASLVPQLGHLEYKGSQWNLILEVPTSTAFASATQTTLAIIFLFILIINFMSALILLMNFKWVTTPIGLLTKTIQEIISSGDLTKQVEVKSQDEIGQLAISFNTMVEKLGEFHKNLEQKIAERTQELSAANLKLKNEIQDRKRLENVALQSEKMAAVGQLAGGVAHEINNPLGVILGFSQSVVRKIKEGDPLELPLKSIEREAIRCKALVQDLLTFSRTGKNEKEFFNLNQAIETSLSLVNAQSKVKNIDLIKEFDPGLNEILANKNQIQQIIINLCNNSIDAMPQGGCITLRTKKSVLDYQEAVQIQVQDTGIGIPFDIQSKIFEPFFTTKDVGKGTGLGLSLVYEIIQKHSGQIKVESSPGKGTTFFITLPLSAKEF